MISNIKIGSDCEFFLSDQTTGEIVSAEGIIKGSKEEPFFFEENDPYYATSLDNVMAEGNIPPCTTDSEFFTALNHLKKYIANTIPSNLGVLSIASARLDPKYLQTENAMMFGCEPSLSCWDLSESRPMPSGDNLRSTGFHIHISYDNPNEQTSINIAKAMDLFLGVPSLITEPENERKQVGYGCAGNIRIKKYGLEYRVLSGYFASSEKLIKWCFNNTMKAIAFVQDSKNVMYLDMKGYEIQTCINENDVNAAYQLINEKQIEICQ
jgi:hypothetical protein